MTAAIAAIVYFFVIYRVAPLSSIPYISVFVGLIGVALFFQETQNKSVRLPQRFNLLAYSLIVLILYLITRDTIAAFTGNISQLGIVRIISAIGLSIMPAYFLARISRAKPKRILKILTYVLFTQLGFFVFLYLNPGLKTAVYAFFGMSGSVNLNDWNLQARGFGVSSEINFLAPIATVLIACLVSQNVLFRMLVMATQIVNTNLTILSVLFLLAGGNLMRAFGILAFMTIVLLLTQDNLLGMLEVYAPRLIAELNSGLTQTLGALLSGHVHLLTDGFASALFGTGTFITSGDNIFLVRSDIGWVNLYNYGGLILIAIFMVFLVGLVLPLRGEFAKYRIPLLIVLIGVNIKGLFLGPNALLFVIFILHFSDLGRDIAPSKSTRTKKPRCAIEIQRAVVSGT